MSETAVRTTREGAIGRITLADARRRNALSTATMRALIEALAEMEGDASARVVVLDAEGPAFSAGHDLREMTAGKGIDFYRRIFDLCTELMTKVRELSKPVVAQVDGIATAAGCQLVAACDLAVASEESSFATPGVKIGLFCSTPMVELVRAVGRKRALEMLLTGAPITAATAAEWGLINRAVPREKLAEETRALAEKIADASSLTIGLGKQAFYAQVDLDHGKAYAYAKEVMSMNALAADAQEGMNAFLEKRPACWKGE